MLEEKCTDDERQAKGTGLWVFHPSSYANSATPSYCKNEPNLKSPLKKPPKHQTNKWESCLVLIHMLNANFHLTYSICKEPQEAPVQKQTYRILLERRPHLSLVSALNSWRSQHTEEQCTWSSFPAHHTSSTVCGENSQCHHIISWLLSSTPLRG